MIELIWLGFKGALIIYSGIMFTLIGVTLLFYSGYGFVKLFRKVNERGTGK
ncbi:hypothetical protein LCGC14_0970160 [marine sediment metagenome]|uniref:Uncharacterized protein n=1 Tax=marine sediment metagenome TaxID=412755 RepID=A0A0F9RIA1_9ZZZZ